MTDHDMLLVPCDCHHPLDTIRFEQDPDDDYQFSVVVMWRRPGFLKRVREAFRYVWAGRQLDHSECLVAWEHVDALAAFMQRAVNRKAKRIGKVVEEADK